MSSARLCCGALLLGAISCARYSPSTTVKPKEGPVASVHASWTGGVLNRRADALFRVEEASYVMVAHLGGDGRIEVLYPQDSRETGRIPAKKWFRTQPFSAYYDAVPELYSFTTTRYRSLSSRFDSYDGLGNGFIFMIASKHLLRFDRISSYGMWDDFELEDYYRSFDPRESILTFARMIAGDSEFTLKYASNFGASSYSSLADQRMDCAYLGSFGMSMFGSAMFYNFGFLGLTSPYRYLSGCGRSYDPYWDMTRYYRQTAYFPSPANPNTPEPTVGPRRPGRRAMGSAGPALGFNRPTFNPTTNTGTTSSIDFAPRGRRPGFAPRTGESGSTFSDSRTFGGRGTRIGAPPSGFNGSRTPVYDAPRSTPTYGGSRFTPSETRHATPHAAPAAPAAQPTAAPARTTTVEVKGNPEAKKP